MKCRVCGRETTRQFSQKILNRYVCGYFFCASCGFLQTEEPFWLDDAYQSAIANADTGLVYRNVTLAKTMALLLFGAFDRRGRYLDAAGGYGMLTRLMRDAGFDYYWSDLYCENLLARGFEAGEAEAPFTAITAFEVMEHVPRPMAFVEQTLARAQTRTMIFSTELYEGLPPRPGEWWYYSFETGQHIAFYQRRTLETIAGQLGLRFYSHRSLHMLTDQAIRPEIFRILTYPRLGGLAAPWIKRALGSKMMKDNQMLLARVDGEAVHENPDRPAS